LRAARKVDTRSVRYEWAGRCTAQAETGVILETLFYGAVHTAMDNLREVSQCSARHSPGDLGFCGQRTLTSGTCVSLKMHQ
jgi:hypothetical protein